MQARVERLVTKIEEAGLGGLLVTEAKNIFYLTGFSGTAGTVFVSPKRRIFVTDDRYALIAKQTIQGFDIISTRTALTEIANAIADDGLETLGFEDTVSYQFYQALKAAFPHQDLQAQTNFVEGLRIIKDADEAAIIRRACQISDQAFIDALDFIKPGKTELEVANFLDFRMRELGASGISFDTIAASGFRSAMPHGRASDKVIEAGESLTLDFGCYYQHYASDMTRTVHVGHVTDEEREIYAVTLAANQALIDQARAGMTYIDFDRVPRQLIEDKGYGANFTHGIGHGLGLDVHELPFFTKTADELKPGMVVTDEPGIYLDGLYGVRIEDDLLITETGCEVLTLAPKELIVL
ncbi:M24 family metallopeptidase [Streptococcus caprae]|uniref:M24 family metallopeptidase n=1 Tax=Streptococcus caprae TaxID=1640501 RepID=A0ABV8CTQ2_9STRE